MKKELIFLLLIILLFLGTRLYKINEVPPSLYWDEASIGYNAYSILKAGQDEWGQKFPLEFKAFGEYKLPVYIYSTIPFIFVFGLNEFSVRLPAVLFSLACIFLTYLLGKKISDSEKVGLFSAFFITVSPWFFIFSRTGYETTAGLMFFLLGIYLWLLDKKNLILIIAVVSFILSMYSYNSFRIIVPLSLAILIASNIKSFKNDLQKKYLIFVICSGLFLLSLIPIVQSVSEGNTGTRLQAIGIFDVGKKETIKKFVNNYFLFFSPQFLFIRGDINQRSQQAGFGELYYLDLAVLISGLIYIFKKKQFKLCLPIVLFLLTPIPAAITREAPHALRSLAAVPFIAIILSLGVTQISSFLKKGQTYIIIVVIYVSFFVFYLLNFYQNYSSQSSKDWQYAYKQIYQEYEKDFNNFDHIVISDRFSQPYIFTLFYLKYNPDLFRSSVQYNTSIRKATSLVKSFSKFQFKTVDFNNLPQGKNLIFASSEEKLDKIIPKGFIKNKDNSIALYVYQYEKR